MPARRLKIAFHMIDEVGPQNACIGLGQTLLRRGHEVYFLTKTNNRREGKFTDYGFKVVPLTTAADATAGDISEEQALVETKAMLKMRQSNGTFDNIDPIEKMTRMFDDNMIGAFLAIFAEYDRQIRAWIEAEKPDLLVVDSIGAAPPSLMLSNIPWVYIYCSNPIGFFHSPDLPPPTFGLPVAGPKDCWPELQARFDEVHDKRISQYNRQLIKDCGYQIPENLPDYIVSPFLNIYQFPEELDYHDVIRIPEKHLRVDAFCRVEPGQFQLPAELKSQMKPGDKLIYFSLGSVGSSNVQLMNRIVGVLAKTAHFYIVSMGLFHDEIPLPANMWGAQYVPQTQVLQQVDLAIIHGGNNSLTEAIHYGVPVIVMPLFYDQHDNARRVEEKAFGLEVNPYTFSDEQLLDAVEKVLADEQMKNRLVSASRRIQSSQSKERACDAMEKLVVN